MTVTVTHPTTTSPEAASQEPPLLQSTSGRWLEALPHSKGAWGSTANNRDTASHAMPSSLRLTEGKFEFMPPSRAAAVWVWVWVWVRAEQGSQAGILPLTYQVAGSSPAALGGLSGGPDSDGSHSSSEHIEHRHPRLAPSINQNLPSGSDGSCSREQACP